jgi:histidine ammonia-lyase
MLAGSPIVASHATPQDVRVQDAYSIRCTPSVHGAVRDTLAHCRTVAEHELASAIDNPMVFPDGRVQSCGNFHGVPLGFAADFLAIALSEIGAIAERRIDRMLDKTRSHGLPAFLADEVGVDSGLMIGHYTAAAMASENKRLSAPASVDSLPTSGMQEDHVSMAWLAARKLRRVVDNVRRILAVEYVCAARALDLRAPLESSMATDVLRALLRRVVAGPGPDRYLAPELAAAEQLLDSSELHDALSSAGVVLARLP